MPGRLILTTVGTSSVNRDKLERLYLWSAWQDLRRSLPKAGEGWHRAWVEQEPPKAILRFRNSYSEFVADLDIDDEIKKPGLGGTNVFSGELTSLHLLRPQSEDSIVLLLSDSPDGVICGLLVQHCLKDMSIYPELQIIAGLQVENFRDFFDNGLDEFFRVITSCIEKFPGRPPILNVTGGFKSFIPFATYAALAHKMKLYFSYEEQPEPIVIDPSQWPESVQKKVEDFQQELRHQPMLMCTPIVDEY